MKNYLLTGVINHSAAIISFPDELKLAEVMSTLSLQAFGEVTIHNTA